MSTLKHCEVCGAAAPNGFYRFLSMATGIVSLDSPSTQRVDRNRGIAYLADGREIQYAFDFETYGLQTSALIPHFFCPNGCERVWVNQFSASFSINELRQLVHTPLDNRTPMGVSVEPYSRECREDQCSYCGDSFPNDDKAFAVAKILSSKEVPGSMSNPDISMVGTPYDFNSSDISNANPVGKWIMYQRDLGNIDRSKLFCSNDCCLGFASDKKSIVEMNSNLFGGSIVAVVPELAELNRNLKEKNLYNPIDLGYS